MDHKTREILHLLLRLEVEKWVRELGRLDLILFLYKTRNARKNGKG